jgi:hypothetical protein
MPTSESVDSTFRQLIYDGKATYEQLWIAFWSGKFEYRGKSRVTIELPPEVRPATRDLLIHLYPDGRWVPNPGQTTKDREAHWSRFAAIPQHEIDDTWRKNTFGKILISPEAFDAWQEKRNDEIGNRILRVLEKAARIKRENLEMSDRVVAKRVLGEEKKYFRYHEATIRRIIVGNYRPAMNRGFPDLSTWIGRNS